MLPQAVLCFLVTTATAFDGRIVGGEPADIADFRYQLIVYCEEIYLCGGVLIESQKAITVASCVYPFRHLQLRVQANSTFRNNFGSGEFIEVFNISIPTAFRYDSTDYDVAVLRLKFPSMLGVPIPLINSSNPMPVGASGTITGYGTVAIGVPTNRLHKGVVQRISDTECNDFYSDAVTSRMFCCMTDGVDACLGDDGGPLVYNGTVAGLVA